MGSFRRVLCAIDIGWHPGRAAPEREAAAPLGEAAEVTLLAADREARLHGASLTILHALPTMYPGAPMYPEALEQALLRREELSSLLIDAILSALTRLTPRDPSEVSIEIADAPPDEAILQGARHLLSDLIVVGGTAVSGGRRRHSLGGVANSVSRHSHTSVLVARRADSSGGIVVGYDFTPSGERAAAAAVEEARRRHAPLTLIHSLDLLPPEMVLSEPGLGIMVPGTLPGGLDPDESVRRTVRRRLEEALERLGVEGDVEVAAGPPAHALAEAAAKRGADLVVVGTSNRTGIDRLLLGSVSTKVVREAPCSVLVARPSEQPEARVPQDARL
jgi:nucleotide-binding universal stress UspA family protein